MLLLKIGLQVHLHNVGKSPLMPEVVQLMLLVLFALRSVICERLRHLLPHWGLFFTKVSTILIGAGGQGWSLPLVFFLAST